MSRKRTEHAYGIYDEMGDSIYKRLTGDINKTSYLLRECAANVRMPKEDDEQVMGRLHIVECKIIYETPELLK